MIIEFFILQNGQKRTTGYWFQSIFLENIWRVHLTSDDLSISKMVSCKYSLVLYRLIWGSFFVIMPNFSVLRSG